MGETADQLRQELDATRESASDKISQLEAKVEATSDRVKENFDVKKQVAERPLVALGAAFFGGLLLGGVMGGDDQRPHHQPSPGGAPSPGHEPKGGGITGALRNAAKESGFDETLSNLAAAAMGMMTEKMKDAADRTLPGFADKFQSAQHAGGSLSAKSQAAQETQFTDTPGTAPQRGSGYTVND